MRLDFAKSGMGYESQEELLEDWKALLDRRIYLYYRHHAWLGPENSLQNMMGLVVSREEFEFNLLRSSRERAYQGISEAERRDLEAVEALVESRAARSRAKGLPALELSRRLGLGRFERDCVLLGFAAATDGKYEKLFGYLQDDAARKLPGMALCCQLFTPPGGIAAGGMARFHGESLFAALFEARAWEAGDLALCPFALDFLLGAAPRLPRGLALLGAKEPLEPLLIRREFSRELETLARGNAGMIVLRGEAGSGKRLYCRHALAGIGKGALFADLREMAEDIRRGVRGAAAAALLHRACPCFLHGESLEEREEHREPAFEEAVGGLAPGRAPVFLLTENRYRAVGLSGRMVVAAREIAKTTREERAALLTACLGDWTLGEGTDAREIAVKFRFTPLQLANAVRQAKGLAAGAARRRISAEEIHRCCLGQAVHRLDELAVKTRPAHGWDDLVLPEPQVRLLREACAHVRQSYKVYGEWGFAKRVQYGRGVSMLFAGPPGTGKTMAAQVVARQLRLELYKVQISQVVSKYIGETEKNLREVFAEARKSNGILFFDECDALFGKRASEVKDSNDRNANLETAYLLQQVEEHDGVVILATNLMQNIDPAFLRRIGFVVHFPFPEKGIRERIYRGMLPKEAPVAEDIDFGFLAERFKVSGGGIKNIVLHAAFLAAEEGAPIGMRHLVRAAVDELRKNEIVVVREDLREYADLAFD